MRINDCEISCWIDGNVRLDIQYILYVNLSDATQTLEEKKQRERNIITVISLVGKKIFIRSLSFQFSRGIREDESVFALIQPEKKGEI